MELAAALVQEAKNRTEILMSVDLLRNHLGLIPEIGSMRVAALFNVETYLTVHQLVWLVVERLR